MISAMYKSFVPFTASRNGYLCSESHNLNPGGKDHLANDGALFMPYTGPLLLLDPT